MEMITKVPTMSNAPSTIDHELSQIADDHRFDLQSAAESTLRTLAIPVQFTGFWSAVVLPLLYVPVFGGYAGDQSALAVLLVVHALALICGHDHRRN